MVQLVIFINLFFVPLFPLYVLHRKRQMPLEPTLNLLFQYGMTAVCNIPLTKVFIFLAKRIGGVYISIDSGYYTVAALLPTILLILAYKFYKVYPDHTPWKEKMIQKGAKGVLRDLAPALIVLFVCFFMLFIFEPILMYATNIDDVWFDLQGMIMPVLFVFFRFFVIGAVVAFAIYNADLMVSKQVILYKGIILIATILFFLLYLQGNWLAGNLPGLTGDAIIWENYGEQENFVLVSAAVILAVAMMILIRKRGLDRVVSYAAMGSSAVFVMLFVSLVSTVLVNHALVPKDTFSATLRNYNTVSSNKNFLIFLVDATDSQVFYDVMMEDEDFRGMMEDFTYFPDTLSVYPYTRDSLPNILTGVEYRNETGFRDYSSSAYNQSPLFEKLAQNGYGINLYSDMITWEGEKSYNIENAASIHDTEIDFDIFMEQELKYIRYKYLPYGLKQFSEVETLDFNTCIITNYDGYIWGNVKNYRYMKENSVLDKQSQNFFQFMHCEGSHALFNMDKNLEYVEGGRYDQKVAATLTLIKTYLQRLKDNDAYDNSAIVIMADHGDQVHGDFDEPYLKLSKCNPILFIKGINEKHEMLVSDRSVSYAELNDALCALIDGKQSTELFAELEPGRIRTVFWEMVNEEYHKVEYRTTGKAWEYEMFTPTGNVYDLQK